MRARRRAGHRVAQGLPTEPGELEVRSTGAKSVTESGQAALRVHDLRHTYASLSRRAGADLRLLQKAMGHASITVTAHTYADLIDDELLPHRHRARLARRHLSRSWQLIQFGPILAPFRPLPSEDDVPPKPVYSTLSRINYRGGQGRDRTGDLPLFRRTLVPTELPGRKARCASPNLATLTGLEPATSAVTGRRANQLRHRALLYCSLLRRSPRSAYPLRDSNPRYRLERAAS